MMNKAAVLCHHGVDIVLRVQRYFDGSAVIRVSKKMVVTLWFG